MKIKLLLLFLITLTSLKAFPQTKNSISIIYSLGANSMYSNGVKSDAGYQNGGTNMFGVTYVRSLNNRFGLETGIVYSTNNLEMHAFNPPSINITKSENFNLISIPVMARINFAKFMFANAGLMADIQTNSQNLLANNQSGIGFELGIGARQQIKQFTLFINPSLQEHSVIAFTASNVQYRLLQAGIKIGAAYNF